MNAQDWTLVIVWVDGALVGGVVCFGVGLTLGRRLDRLADRLIAWLDRRACERLQAIAERAGIPFSDEDAARYRDGRLH